MVKKVVNALGSIQLLDGDNCVTHLETTVDKEKRSVMLKITGTLRTDVQVYFGTELSFYKVAPIKELLIDCSELKAISPGCFGELLDAKIQMQEKKGKFEIISKPECLLRMEKLMNKKL